MFLHRLLDILDFEWLGSDQNFLNQIFLLSKFEICRTDLFSKVPEEWFHM